MSVERIQTNDVNGTHLDAPISEVTQKPYDSNAVGGMVSPLSAKGRRKAQIEGSETELWQQHKFELQYRMLMQKFEMEIGQMRRQLFASPDSNEGIPYKPVMSTYPRYGHNWMRNAITRHAGEIGKNDLLLENYSNTGIDYQAEVLKRDSNFIPDTSDLGSNNFLQKYGGDIVTSNSEGVTRELYDWCNRHNVSDEKQDVSLAYSNLAHCVNSFIEPWGEKTFEHQKFKPELFKTEMCRSWTKFGLCPYGESCRFAHGMRELRMRPKPHWKYKTEMCKKFLRGFCPYGSRCNFLHMPFKQHTNMPHGTKYCGKWADQSIRESAVGMAQISVGSKQE